VRLLGPHIRLAALLVALAASPIALAASPTVHAACPGDTGEPLPATEKLQGLEDMLAPLASECGAHAGYLAYRGAVLNALGRHTEAALLLERALLLDPARAGAQIDYAEALGALGDRASAAALLRDVISRPDMPAPLRPQLERRLSAIEALQRIDALSAMSAQTGGGAWITDGWNGTGSLALKLGRDSNLNSAPAREALTLTLPGGDAILQLADRFRPRAGSAARLEASGQWIRPMEGGAALQLYGDARLRDSPAASDTSYQQVQAGGAWNQSVGGAQNAEGIATFGASATQLRYGGEDLYRALRLSASRDWRMALSAGDCRPSAGLEGESRSYPTASELGGRYLGLSAGLACNFGVDRLALAARGGQYAGRADRAGGNQRQTDLRLVWSRPIGAGRLGGDLLWYRQQDASGFSPLLDNGATRRLSRTTLYLEYSYPIAPRWAFLASLEGLAQRSNLELFDISGKAFYIGLRWTSGR
jgi:tetratricopeptide (TPR) repeat protein